MKIKYKSKIKGQDIDIDKLRPNNSYSHLIKNRNGSLQAILDNIEEHKDLLKYRNCPSCMNNEYDNVIKKDNLDIVKCKLCKTIYVNPIFDEEKYKDLYKSEEYNEIIIKHTVASHTYRKNRFGNERMGFINEHHDLSLKKRYLDIGCATGFTLEVAEENGWDAVGIELTPASVDFARKRNLQIIDKPLEDIDFDEKFSAISLFDVLEHLSNPREILDKVHESLVDGGNVFIYVPNWNSATRQLLKEENSHFIWPSHHLTYFTPETLKEFIERSGFEVFFWETQGLDLADFKWFLDEKENKDTKWIEEHGEILQYYINASGNGKNLRMFAKKVSK
jgi:SAM-dependent methyltransferase|tara:strand:+ start:21541 stop:22545 length:1005 start_codon:yes stop_codon:yes gene_type:complete